MVSFAWGWWWWGGASAWEGWVSVLWRGVSAWLGGWVSVISLGAWLGGSPWGDALGGSSWAAAWLGGSSWGQHGRREHGWRGAPGGQAPRCWLVGPCPMVGAGAARPAGWTHSHTRRPHAPPGHAATCLPPPRVLLCLPHGDCAVVLPGLRAHGCRCPCPHGCCCACFACAAQGGGGRCAAAGGGGRGEEEEGRGQGQEESKEGAAEGGGVGGWLGAGQVVWVRRVGERECFLQLPCANMPACLLLLACAPPWLAVPSVPAVPMPGQACLHAAGGRANHPACGRLPSPHTPVA